VGKTVLREQVAFSGIGFYKNFLLYQPDEDYYGITWDGNYWSDYVGIKIRIPGFIGIPYHIPGRMNQWDTHPRMTPVTD